MQKFRLLLILITLAATASHAWAIRGGPFDSSSGIGGLDPIRGTYQTVFRGENAIGYCFFSSASDLDTYGSIRGYISTNSVAGSVGGTVTDKEVFVVFSYAGVTEFRRVEGIGFLDQKIEQSFFPLRASGSGETTIRITEIRRESQVIDDEGGAEQVVTLEFFDTLPPETIQISGETRQISLEPSQLFFTVIRADGTEIGPLALDPTNPEEILNILNQVGNNNNNNNNN